MLAALSLSAALIHAAVVPQHSGLLGWMFAATAVAQGAWALLVIARPRRDVLIAGLVINAGAVGVYLASRTVGLGSLEAVEPFGTADVVCALIEAAIVVSAGYLLSPRNVLPSYRRIGPIAAASVVAIVVMISVPGLVATTGHNHSAGGSHDAGSHDVISPADQARANRLVADTQRFATRWEDPAVATADGYETISHSAIEHFINWKLVAKPGTLDPRHPESLVYVARADGTLKLTMVMYVVPWGTKEANVPSVAGSTWHTHPNLCFDAERRHVVSYSNAKGVCPTGRILAIPPMLHVSLVPNACGPFGDVPTALDPTSRALMARVAAFKRSGGKSATSEGDTSALAAAGPGAPTSSIDARGTVVCAHHHH